MSARAEAVKALHARGARLCRFVWDAKAERKKAYRGDATDMRGCTLAEALEWADDKWLAILLGDLGLAVVDQDHGGEAAREAVHKLLGDPLCWYPTREDRSRSHSLYPVETGTPASKFDWQHGEVFGPQQWAICRDFPGLEAKVAESRSSKPGSRICMTLSEEQLKQLPGKAPTGGGAARMNGAAPMSGRPRIDTMLRYIPADDYSEWISVGMALQAELGDAGLARWISWSRASDKFEEGACEKKWRGFSQDGGVTGATLQWLAEQHGYKPSGGRPAAAGGPVPQLDRVVRVGAGGETVWELTRGSVTVRMTQAELCSQMRFRVLWHASTGEVIRVKQSLWDEAVSAWWSRAEVVEAPSMDDIIWTQLEAFCTDSQAMAREEILNGQPFTEGETTWLRIEDFRLHLASKRVTAPPQRIWRAIRAHCDPQQKIIQEKGIRLRVCGVPKFDEQDSDFTVPNPTGGIDF